VQRRLDSGCAYQIVSERADREAHEWEQDRCKNVVPAGARHAARTEKDVAHQKLQRDEWDMEYRGRDTRLNAFDNDLAESSFVQFKSEGADVA